MESEFAVWRGVAGMQLGQVLVKRGGLWNILLFFEVKEFRNEKVTVLVALK